MVFKLFIVILAILVLDTHTSAIRPLDKWDYGNDLLTLVYKRHPTHQQSHTVQKPLTKDQQSSITKTDRADLACSGGAVRSNCVSPGIPRKEVANLQKRARGNLDLMDLLQSLSHNEIPESEISESNDYEYNREK